MPLPYLEELSIMVGKPHDKPIIFRGYDYNGYYCLSERYPVPFQTIFCSRCGDYQMATTFHVTSLEYCSCTEIYPKNRLDWRYVCIQETYNNKRNVHQELLSKFLEKDMRKITELVIDIKTNSKINWKL